MKVWSPVRDPVGGGRNGSEYSVCLIVALAAIVVSEIYRSRRGPAGD